MLTLQYGSNAPVTDNFLLDTGCKPDLYIPQCIADQLGVPKDRYSQGKIKSAGDVSTATPYFSVPIKVSFSSGRESLREMNSNRAYVGGTVCILGRDAMRALKIGIPENADSIVLYPAEEEEEVL